MFTEDALIRDFEVLRVSAQGFRGDFLEFLPSFHCRGMCGAGHCVSRLAAAGHARVWKMLRRVAPDDFATFPGNAENLSARTVDVDDRLCPQISDSRVKVDVSVGSDHQKPVEADSAADIAAQGHTNSTHFGSDSLGSAGNALLPPELVGTPVERFLDERAGRVRQLLIYRRP